MLGKTAAVPVPISQRQKQDVFYCSSGYKSEYTLFHTSRVIKYVFLDGSQNIVPSTHPSPSFESHVAYLESAKGCYYPLVIPDHSLANSYWSPDLERLPIFVALSKGQQKSNQSVWSQPLFSRDRLPVFQQLCGETTPVSSASRHHRDTAAPKADKEELEKAEDDNMLEPGEKMEREVVEEKDKEATSSKPKMTARERGAKP